MAWQSMETLVASCRSALSDADPAQGIRRALADAVDDPGRVLADLPAFDGDDHLVARESGFSVFLVRQDPDTAGPPHDHRMTAVVAMVDGVEIHRHYARSDDGGVRPDGETRVGPGGTIVLGPDDVHAIANPETTPSIGIHVYLGDLVAGKRTLWDPRSGVAMPFTEDAYNQRVSGYREGLIDGGSG